MTKKEFIEILKQVEESLKNNINQQKKEILGLVDDFQLLPFNEISPNLFPYGYYWKDENGEWRVNMFMNDDSKEQAKELENKKGLKFTNHRERAKIEEEINIIPSYEVNFEMKCIPDSYDFPSIIIDNKIIFEICINEKPKTMAARWNKTLLEHYRGKRAKQFKIYLDPFYEWFEVKEIDIEKVGSLIESEIEKETLYIKLYEMTNIYIEGNGDSINKSVIKVYNDNRKIFKTDWENGSIRNHYYLGKNLKEKLEFLI